MRRAGIIRLVFPALACAVLFAPSANADEAPSVGQAKMAPLSVPPPPQAVAPLPPPSVDLAKYKEESLPGGPLLVAAYGVMWLLIGGSIVRLLLRQSKLESEIKTLQDRLDQPQGQA